MSTPATGKAVSAPRSGHRIAGSTHTSPSVHSSPQGAPTGGMALSSLRGDYVHAVIQVTRDMVPVVFTGWTLPFDGAVDLGIADVTLAQLLPIAERKNLLIDLHRDRPTSTSEWTRSLSSRIISLRDLLQVSERLLAEGHSFSLICTCIRFCPSSWVSALNWRSSLQRYVHSFS
jgi:hypothetical protein